MYYYLLWHFSTFHISVVFSTMIIMIFDKHKSQYYPFSAVVRVTQKFAARLGHCKKKPSPNPKRYNNVQYSSKAAYITACLHTAQIVYIILCRHSCSVAESFSCWYSPIRSYIYIYILLSIDRSVAVVEMVGLLWVCTNWMIYANRCNST